LLKSNRKFHMGRILECRVPYKRRDVSTWHDPLAPSLLRLHPSKKSKLTAFLIPVSQRVSHFINDYFDRISTWSGDNWGYLGLPDSSMYLPKSASDEGVDTSIQTPVDEYNSTDTSMAPIPSPTQPVPVKCECNESRCTKDSPACCANGSC
jgi:hypothetical protein